MTGARAIVLLVFIASQVFASALVAGNDLLLRAKDLYRNAAYEEALAALDQITNAAAAPEYIEASNYRLFCLIALGRKDEARSAIELIVNRDPFYQMPTEQASPRVRTLFTEVRQALLPEIVQQAYTDARAAFDRKDPTSAARFQRVIDLLNDPDIASRPALGELRIVTSGFRDLSKEFAQPQTPVPTVASPASVASVPGPSGSSSRVVYREGEAGVIAPIPLNQKVPVLAITDASALRASPQGTLELIIDENGTVVSATIAESIHPKYDQQLLKAATSWKYVPARKDGAPVSVRKFVRVRVVPN
jgi:TonB family protein